MEAQFDWLVRFYMKSGREIVYTLHDKTVGEARDFRNKVSYESGSCGSLSLTQQNASADELDLFYIPGREIEAIQISKLF